MKIKCIACEALARSVYLAAALSPHSVDIALLRIGLHNTPAKLRSALQQAVDDAAEQEFDVVVLAYGLCGKALHGLQARRQVLVMPRAHDCITLFLGSRARYQEQQELSPGTYWYTQDYIERGQAESATLSLGTGFGFGTEEEIQHKHAEFVEKYGQENADYLMEVMGAWQSHYSRAVYIDLGAGDGREVAQLARDQAARRGWTFEQMQGNIILIKRLLSGSWNEDFLVVQPGQAIRMTYGDDVVGAEASNAS